MNYECDALLVLVLSLFFFSFLSMFCKRIETADRACNSNKTYLARVLEGFLNSAEIIESDAWSIGNLIKSWLNVDNLFTFQMT